MSHPASSSEPQTPLAMPAAYIPDESPLPPLTPSADDSSLNQNSGTGASYSSVAATNTRVGFTTPRETSPLRRDTSFGSPRASNASSNAGVVIHDNPEESRSSPAEEHPWITVGRGGRPLRTPTPEISPTQEADIRRAEELLTQDQRDAILRRRASVHVTDDDSMDTESTPRDKGKSVDPRERGEPILRLGGLDPVVNAFDAPTEELKAVAPTVFTGEPKIDLFNRWMREGLHYLDDARVERRKEIRALARYTEGKAQAYYQNVIADDESNWTLEEYFKAIYDACFPSNFREKQRRKLERFYQGELLVKEYAAQMYDMINTIGGLDTRQRVVHLFRGLNPELAIACRRMGLNPEDASWDEVVAEAENEEIVLSSIRKDKVRVDKHGKDVSTPSKASSLHSSNGTSRPGSNSAQRSRNF
ncbi:hypothetical protein PTI98_010471 [Pleurotus ostreatus]|nr:hypothetical protein PTI98_010471 [Pleurotus ostreatus]